jgi:hypothetical protein
VEWKEIGAAVFYMDGRFATHVGITARAAIRPGRAMRLADV